jgi:hypothetical protein
LSVESFASLIGSLETYREAAGLLGGRVKALAWHAGVELDYGTSAATQAAFDGIRRDWKEFGAQSAFLESFLQHHTDIKTEKVDA